jgi:hypothetical protein
MRQWIPNCCETAFDEQRESRVLGSLRLSPQRVDRQDWPFDREDLFHEPCSISLHS